MGFIDLTKQGDLEIAKGIRARIVTAESMTVAHVKLDAGAVLPEHDHVHEQVVNVIRGELELTVAGVSHNLTPGMVMVLAPNVPHAGRAVTETRVIDVFHPVREDFRGTSFAGYSGAKD